MPTDERSIHEYNSNYLEWLNNKGLGHSHLEKPAMYSMMGDVSNKDVLCIGCGAGEECDHISSLGARRVVGIDISQSLISIAKTNYPHLEFMVMDMENLKLPGETFDIVYSSLVLHYIRDWTVLFNSIRGILNDDGFFLFSTHNPVYWSAEKRKNENTKTQILGFTKEIASGNFQVYGDYLTIRKIDDTWFDNFKVSYYHKPISSILNDILTSSLKLVECLEPGPLESAKKIDIDFWHKASKIPLFIIFKLAP